MRLFSLPSLEWKYHLRRKSPTHNLLPFIEPAKKVNELDQVIQDTFQEITFSQLKLVTRPASSSFGFCDHSKVIATGRPKRRMNAGNTNDIFGQFYRTLRASGSVSIPDFERTVFTAGLAQEEEKKKAPFTNSLNSNIL